MGAVDDAARWWAEAQVRARAERYYPSATVVARIRAPRFLGPLLRRGVVSDIRVALFDAQVDRLRLRRLDVVLHEVRVSRRELLRRRIRLRELGSGRIEVEIDGPSLAATVKLPLLFHADEVEMRPSVGPLAVSARGVLSVEHDVLRFRPGSLQGMPLPVSMDFEFRLPTSPIWPRAADVRSIEGGLLVSCELDDVPPGLIGPTVDSDLTPPASTS